MSKPKPRRRGLVDLRCDRIPSEKYLRKSRKPNLMESLTGESYRHPPGYVPIYQGLTDVPAFHEGERDFRAGVLPSKNPHAGSPRKAESWTDGWAYASAQAWWFNLPEMPKPFGIRKSAFKRTRSGEKAA